MRSAAVSTFRAHHDLEAARAHGSCELYIRSDEGRFELFRERNVQPIVRGESGAEELEGIDHE